MVVATGFFFGVGEGRRLVAHLLEQVVAFLQFIRWRQQVHIAHRSQGGVLVNQLTQVQTFEGDDRQVLRFKALQDFRQLVVQEQVAGGGQAAGLLHGSQELSWRGLLSLFYLAVEKGGHPMPASLF